MLKCSAACHDQAVLPDVKHDNTVDFKSTYFAKNYCTHCSNLQMSQDTTFNIKTILCASYCNQRWDKVIVVQVPSKSQVFALKPKSSPKFSAFHFKVSVTEQQSDKNSAEIGLIAFNTNQNHIESNKAEIGQLPPGLPVVHCSYWALWAGGRAYCMSEVSQRGRAGQSPYPAPNCLV